MKNLEITLCPGDWQIVWRDKKTFAFLSDPVIYKLIKSTNLKIKIPENVVGNKNARLISERIR